MPISTPLEMPIAQVADMIARVVQDIGCPEHRTTFTTQDASRTESRPSCDKLVGADTEGLLFLVPPQPS
jgi:hypothetical protein